MLNPLDPGTAAGGGGATATPGTGKPADLTQEEVDAMAVAGGGMPGSRQLRTLAELDIDVAKLSRAVETLQQDRHGRRAAVPLIIALGGLAVSVVMALAVANITVSRYQSRLAAAATAQISEIREAASEQINGIRKAASGKLVEIKIEAGNRLAEIKEAAAARAAETEEAETEEAPAQATAPAKAEGEKPTTEAPAKADEQKGAPATVAAPAPAAAPVTQTDDRLKAALERIQRAKKGGR